MYIAVRRYDGVTDAQKVRQVAEDGELGPVFVFASATSAAEGDTKDATIP